MRFRWITILLIALLTLAFLLLNIYGLFELIEIFKNRQFKKVQEFQNKHRIVDDSNEARTTTPAVTVRQWNGVTEKTRRIEVQKPTETSRKPQWIWSSTTPSTTVTVTTPRIRSWTHYPRPTNHGNRHEIHHGTYREHDRFQLKYETTTQSTTTTTTTQPTTTSRIRITTQSNPSVETKPTEMPYARITIPASSSYRNPYIHRIDVVTSTNRAVDSAATSHHQHHHHHHHHNRTHIDIHSHHHHQKPAQQPERISQVHYPSGIYPYQLPRHEQTTTTVSTTEGKHHQHHHHHHHHHHHSSTPVTTTTTPSTTSTTTTERTTTTTEQEVEITAKKDEELQMIEDLNPDIDISVNDYLEEEESTTEAITTTTTEESRHRQPEPTQPPLISQEHEFTLVTGLLNIGRGDWFQYRRPLEKYHEFMENVLSLKNNMVIFTDSSSYDFAHKYRKNLGLMHMTRIYKISIEELPLYGYINEAKDIIKNELSNDTFYKLFADSDMKTHPEAKSAEYNIVVNSKTHFLHNVTMENPFGTEHFIWLDAGYGHGNQSVFPYNNVWRPQFPDGKISLIKLTPEYDKLQGYSLDNLYRKNWAVLSGGFIAGDKHSIGQLHSIIHRKFIQLIYQKFVDDDQTLLVIAVNSYPHLFNIVHGDWFDAFRLFSVDADLQLG